MGHPQPLSPKGCMQAIAARVRKRIEVLTAVRLPGFEGTLHELRVVLDLLERAIRYVETGQGKTGTESIRGTATPASRKYGAR